MGSPHASLYSSKEKGSIPKDSKAASNKETSSVSPQKGFFYRIELRKFFHTGINGLITFTRPSNTCPSCMSSE